MHTPNNRRGAALVWAVCALLILAILTTALAATALSYHRRGMGDEYARQAWLTARAATDTVLAVLQQETIPGRGAATAQAAYAALQQAYPWLPPVGQQAELQDFTLNLSPLGGTVEAVSLSCSSSDGAVRLSVTARAALDGWAAGLTLHAALARGEDGAYVWSAEGYE